MTEQMRINGKILKNLIIFKEFKEIGFDYILNPETEELHKVDENFYDSHNLHIANLENYIGITNIGIIPIHRFNDGTKIPIYDLITGDFLGEYKLNKCKHCSW